MEAHFEDVELHMPGTQDDEEDNELGEENDNDPSLRIQLDEGVARINLATMVSLLGSTRCRTPTPLFFLEF